MATGMDDFGVFFSDSMGVPGQSEGDASMLKRRFREFFREFRGADSSYIYRRQLELAISTKSNSICVEVGDLTSYDSSLTDHIREKPTTVFEILEEAARQVADEVTRPRKDNEPIPADLHVQLVSGMDDHFYDSFWNVLLLRLFCFVSQYGLLESND